VVWALLAGPAPDGGSLWDTLDAADRAWCVSTLLAHDSIVSNPTFCHGLAGRLDLWTALAAGRDAPAAAHRRARAVAATLRQLALRAGPHVVWSSESPSIVTPDLWVGFLGPAAALARHACRRSTPLFSLEWLRVCAGAVACA
jgi:hypothetical protein